MLWGLIILSCKSVGAFKQSRQNKYTGVFAKYFKVKSEKKKLSVSMIFLLGKFPSCILPN
jgi:hypothetical protein